MKKSKKIISAITLTFLLLSNSVFAAEHTPSQETKYLIPGGQSIGVTLETDGVLISAVAEVYSAEGSIKAPAADAGLRGGDIIKSLDKKSVSSVEELSGILESCCGEKTEITFQRGEKLHSSRIIPAKSLDTGKYCIGAWVKDAASGIGTLTFYDTENKVFAALGHGICNPDTGDLIPLEDGKILKSEIVSVEKGEKGIPGELKGIFTENKDVLGNIRSNSSSGIFGTLDSGCRTDKAPVPIGLKEEVKKGKAVIYASVCSGEPESYEIEILKVFPANTAGGKDMIIKITDQNLLEKTGGIVQGMSGSPIIQDGKLIGAVTHVFVNDPTKGYGIFIENMLENLNNIK